VARHPRRTFGPQQCTVVLVTILVPHQAHHISDPRRRRARPTMCVGLGPLPTLFCVQNEPACGDGVRVAVLVDSSLGDLGHPTCSVRSSTAVVHVWVADLWSRPRRFFHLVRTAVAMMAPRGRLVVALVRLMRSTAAPVSNSTGSLPWSTNALMGRHRILGSASSM
jgi:hypothetical protein